MRKATQKEIECEKREPKTISERYSRNEAIDRIRELHVEHKQPDYPQVDESGKTKLNKSYRGEGSQRNLEERLLRPCFSTTVTKKERTSTVLQALRTRYTSRRSHC